MAKFPKQSRSQRVALFAIAILASANLGYQFWLSAHQTRLLSQANTSYLLLAILSQTLVYFAFMPAFRSYFEAANINIPYKSAFRLIISGIGLGKVIPLGEYFVWRRQLRHHRDGSGSVTRFMIVYYSLMFAILLSLFLACELVMFMVLHSHLNNQTAHSFSLLLLTFTAIGVVGVLVAQLPSIRQHILAFFSKQLDSPLYAPWSILKNLNYTWGDTGILVVSITLTLLVEATTLSLCIRALGINPPFILVVFGYCFTRLFSLVPILPGGVGEVEAGTTFFFAAYGYPVSTILTATVIFRLLTYWIPISIGVVSYSRLGHDHEPVWLKRVKAPFIKSQPI